MPLQSQSTASKPTVGLTGGIATGKSTVAALFAELGVPTIDADALAREVVAPGTEGLAEVVSVFGEQMLLADGELDRQRMGALVFEDAGARRQLEAIVHPRIAAAAAEKIASLAEDLSPYVLYEAALLVEKGMKERFAALIVVSTSPALQEARLRERNGLDATEARARIASQLPLDEKKRMADYVIDNEGDLEATRARVAAVHRELLERFGAAA